MNWWFKIGISLNEKFVLKWFVVFCVRVLINDKVEMEIVIKLKVNDC